jgi:anti-sigma28 factor (negative regulator of flagellin synthesis)
MSTDNDTETASDLTALAAAAQGEPVPQRVAPPPRDEAREQKIAELRAQYLAGELTIDEQAVASKMIDALLEDPSS